MVHGISTHVKLSVWTVFEGCSFACSFQGARHLEVVNLFLLLLLLLLLAPLAPPHHTPKMASLNPRDAGLLAVSRCKASQNPHRLTHWVNRFSRCITNKAVQGDNLSNLWLFGVSSFLLRFFLRKKWVFCHFCLIGTPFLPVPTGIFTTTGPFSIFTSGSSMKILEQKMPKKMEVK